MTQLPNADIIDRLKFTQGDRLDKALRVSGMSHKDMAEYLEVSRNTISNYTNDKTPVKRHILVAWALKTGVPLEWILTGDAESRRPGGPDGGKNIQSKDYEMGEIVDLAAHRALRHSPVHDGGSAA